MTTERMDDNSEWPQWLHMAWNTEGQGSLYLNPLYHDGKMNRYDAFCIGTLEGVHQVTPNDFIIQGVAGEIYPCKPHIFEATYDKV